MNGSVRAWKEKALNSQRRSADKLQKSQQNLTGLDADIASKRAVIQEQIQVRQSLVDSPLSNRFTAEWTEEKLLLEKDKLAWDIRALGEKEKSWKKMLNAHKKEALQNESGQWAVYHGEAATETTLTDLITHEIGHYAHRRYGFYDATSLDTLATKTKVYKTVRGRKKWAQSYKPKTDASKISEYATTNDHEYFAEAWADYHANNGARLTSKVKTFIEEVIEANASFTEVASGTEAHKINLGALNRVRKRSGDDAARKLIGHPRLGEL